MIIDGKKAAEEILTELIEERKNLGNIGLGVIVVGDIADKKGFIKVKENFAKKLDIDFRVYEFPENLNRKELRRKISQIVKAKTINAVIIQLPIPKRYPLQYILNSISSKKDIDCLSSRNLGLYFTDTSLINPPAVEVVDYIKNKFDLNFRGETAVVVGYGNLIGKPITHYLLKQGATVSVINSKTTDNVREKLIKEAGIIISGVGKKNLITDCKNGVIAIDFGYSTENGKIFGDIDFQKLSEKASLITPVPAGTGPILVAMLYKNLIKLAV